MRILPKPWNRLNWGSRYSDQTHWFCFTFSSLQNVFARCANSEKAARAGISVSILFCNGGKLIWREQLTTFTCWLMVSSRKHILSDTLKNQRCWELFGSTSISLVARRTLNTQTLILRNHSLTGLKWHQDWWVLWWGLGILVMRCSCHEHLICSDCSEGWW